MEEDEYGFCEPPNYGEKGGNGDAGDHGCLEVDTHFMVYFCSVDRVFLEGHLIRSKK